MTAEANLAALGIALPAPGKPGTNRVPAVRTGNLVYLSGHGPPPGPDGVVPAGKVGRDFTETEGAQIARSVGLALLSSLRDAIGSLDNVTRVVKVLGMVNCPPDFNTQHKVIDGCSDLFVEVFGPDNGRHARSAVGMGSLPLDFPVEIEAIFEVQEGRGVMSQLIGYVSDESHVAIEGAFLEFIRGAGAERTSVEAHSRASGAVYADLEPGEWTVAVGKPGYTRKLTDVEIAPGMRPKRFRLLSDRLLGYAWPKWVRAGEAVELRMHATEPFWVTLWRYGWEKEQVADLGRFDSFGPGGDRQIVPDEDFASIGCQWNHHGYPFGPDDRNVITAPDRPGFYFVHMNARSGAFFNFPLIVAPLPGEETGDVAALASTMDWNAYNDFGGRSNYVAAGELPLEPAVNVRQLSPMLRDTGGRWWSRPDNDYAPLSFDRPEPVNRIDLEETITTPMWRIGSEHVAPATWRLVGWLEREGIAADLYAENQLDSGVLDLDRYRVLILDQHPEYWTRKMYDAVKAWVFERGGRLMYLGGNGLDCEVELVADGAAGIYLNGDQSYYVTNRDFTGGPFSFSPRRIERAGKYECPAALLGVRTTLTGMGTAAPYRLLDADHFAFEGTGLATGDLFGHASLDMREEGVGASGHETDRTCEHAPSGARMLAKGLNPHEGGAELVYFETSSGGAVFSTASISWICSLPIDDGISRITGNVIRHFAADELGAQGAHEPGASAAPTREELPA